MKKNTKYKYLGSEYVWFVWHFCPVCNKFAFHMQRPLSGCFYCLFGWSKLYWMAIGSLNGVLWLCRMPGIMVGKSTKRWTSTGRSCCRKRLVVFSVSFLYLWWLLLTCMRHPVWCCLPFIEQLISEDNWVFLKESTSFIPFFTPTFFFLECDMWSGWKFFTFNFHPCMPEQATRMKWLITPHFTSFSLLKQW